MVARAVVALVMVAAIATAAVTVMATVTEAWALALLSVYRSTGWAITPAIIRTPPMLIPRPTAIQHPPTPIRGQQWHLPAHTPSRGMLRQPQHRHLPSSKTGTTAPTRMPITPMSGSALVVGSESPRSRNADRC